MKKIILSILLLLPCCSVFAQHGEAAMANDPRPALSRQMSEVNISAGLNAVRIGYSQEILRNLYAGATIGYNYMPSSVKSNFTPSLDVRYYWLNTRYFSMYYHMALGVCVSLSNDTSSTMSAAWQIAPLGLEVGGRLRIYTELCANKDHEIINAGLRFRF